ncbi:hypothetical protein SPRG_02906 [Saprolegnia parasitica CBS 223.65]|uniref:Uncharacterized protein n=1 Tax=Saprolegnia parasitica (strain CBS 223.65) TaxID=695850 RepID=A0A067CT43_SAPPC|nr:hypothetical protein SPRG_02906 [Saprolegnia parasitica CBS 223.65]KDO32430.1 hypothetical protein SPRG_02906 [Saprolegnia parasitica CBS 223.65]|eukprot:XP_012196882.1 hypothetical protein SPRG_02906 [Saprolegnia parasitica CBS 223.65]
MLEEVPNSSGDANATIEPVLASMYRVNMLMSIHFNSEKFGGNDFVTVASAEYTCFNRTNDHETCEADSFLENKRVAQPIADVPEYIRPSIDLATRNQYADEEPVWTAYETQELSVAGHMDYVKFVLDGEPVPCTAAFHYDGAKARMVHLDWSCYSATYVETKMRTMIRNGYIKLVATALSIFAVLAAISVYCKRRAVGGSHILRFLAPAAPPVQEKPRSTNEPQKSYSSFRV